MAPDTAEIRPPRNGPTFRQTNAERRRGSTGADSRAADCATSGLAASGTAQSIKRDGARIAESDEEDDPNVSRQPLVRTASGRTASPQFICCSTPRSNDQDPV